jgi:translation initiation factor IF-3
VPVPRRFDRRPPERDQTRINDRIRVPEVRLVGEDGNQIGVVKTAEALRYAQEHDLDLVEVAPEARPPVCRVLDYSKYKYEQAQKLKAARKHQQQITIREIKFRPKIAQNDYDTKKGHVTRFLLGKDKVKVTIMFRGREVTHPERGTALLDRLSGELSEIAVIEQSPIQDGRNMTMMLAPSKSVLAGEHDKSANGAQAAKSDGDSTSAAAETEPAKAEIEPANPEIEPANAEIEPAKAETEPAKAETEPAKADSEPAKAAPAKTKADAAPAKAKAKAEDAPGKADAAPAKADGEADAATG